MQRMLTATLASAAMLLGACSSSPRYAAEVGIAGDRLIPNDGPRVQMPLSVPAPGRYDVALWYFITDAGAGYDALARVTGTADITFRGAVIQRSVLPRHGRRRDLFTDTNGLILLRFEAPSAGRYVLRLNITSVPEHLEISGAGIRLLKLRDTPRPNQAMQLTASKPDVHAWSVCRRKRMLRGMHRGLAAADLVSR